MRSRSNSRSFRLAARGIGAALGMAFLFGGAVVSAHPGEMGHDDGATGHRPGDVVRGRGVSVIAPEPGIGVAVTAHAEDGAYEELVVVTRGNGQVAILDHDSHEPSSGEAGPTAVADSPPACADNAYNLHKWTWNKEFTWRFNMNSVPEGVNAANTETSLKQATNNVTHANNDCMLGDNVGATQSYNGTTDNAANIVIENNDVKCNPNDGVDVVQFGDLPVIAEGATRNWLAATCTWFNEAAAFPYPALESDMRLNKEDYDFYNPPAADTCSGKWSVEAVSTHERLHTFGVQHVAEEQHGRLTASPKIDGACQNQEARLGLGDVNGLEQRY